MGAKFGKRLYTKPQGVSFVIVGITGRVGSGKSFAAHILQEEFCCIVIDLDAIGHMVINYPSIKHSLAQTFGNSILTTSGTIDRSELGKIVFSNPVALQKLNRIVHPVIKSETESILSTDPNSDDLIVVSGALIHEIGLATACHHIINIDANDNDIRNKIGKKFSTIAPLQRSREEYRSTATFTIHNSFSSDFKPTLIGTITKFGLSR